MSAGENMSEDRAAAADILNKQLNNQAGSAVSG
jgi:hypothetical protein